MSSPFELTCKEIVELVTEYLEGRLTAAERARFEQHLLTCAPCEAYLTQMRDLIGLSATLDTEPAIPPPAVLDAFRRWKRHV